MQIGGIPACKKENLLPVSRSTRTPPPPQRITPFPRGFSKLFVFLFKFPFELSGKKKKIDQTFSNLHFQFKPNLHLRLNSKLE